MLRRFAIILIPVALFAQTARTSKKTVWAGTYTAAQAARGQAVFETACLGCHEADLADNDTAARFRGDYFMERWREYDAGSMYIFIRETMPRRQPRSLPDETYIDLVAYLFKTNNFPAGSQALTLDNMKNVQIELPLGPQPLSGGALVQFVGCLTKDENDEWLITRATEPARTMRSMGSTNPEMEEAQAKPLGNQTYRLQNIGFLGADFDPAMHLGHKMQTKGKLIRQPNRDRIDLTSLEMLSETCGEKMGEMGS